MSKKAGKRPNKAKSIVAQPLFRSRQEQAKKGKGSYRRTPERQIIGASYAVDVSQECDAFRDAVLLHLNTAGYHRRWRRPKSSRSSRRDITRR